MNRFYNPVHTIQGKGSLAELPQTVRTILPQGGSVLLLAWDSSVFELEAVKALRAENEFRMEQLCFQASNPTVDQLFELFQKTEELSPKVVIAVGGGSVMDVGKSLCCLYGKKLTSAEQLRTLISEKAYGTPAAKWIGVPTTAGTGSEVTCWATIWDPAKDAKRSVESQENYAYAAIVDPDLTAGMPIALAVSSALDAVAHAVESYWAKGSNAASKALALGAVSAVMEHIDALMDGDETAHEYMSQGSMLAGLAFSNTKTTACHSVSYPLTMHYHIPHGTAVSMLLAPILKINQEKTENMPQLLQALGVTDAEALGRRIRTILHRAGIPASLEEWKVEREKLPELAALGITKGRADNNPVEITPRGIEKILDEIYPSFQ